MPRLKIPTDWDGEDWACIILEWPNSPEWLTILQGLVTIPARGRWWDERTGQVTEVQKIGFEIDGRNDIMSCQDLIDQLAIIATAIQSIDVSQTQNVVQTINLINELTAFSSANSTAIAQQTQDLISVNIAMAAAQASATAWSQAFASNTTSLTVINNVGQQIRPIEPGVDPPPTMAEGEPTGITSVPEPGGDTELCERVFWLYYSSKIMWNFIAEQYPYITGTVLGVAGLIADGVAAAAVSSDPATKRILIPASVLLQVAHKLGELYYNGLFNPAVESVNNWFNQRWEQNVCAVYQLAQGNASTRALQEFLLTDYVSSFGAPDVFAGLLLLSFNLNSLAALYFTASDLDVAPSVPAEYTGICDACGV